MSSPIGSTGRACGPAGADSAPSEDREPAAVAASLFAAWADMFSCCCRSCSRRERSKSAEGVPSEVRVAAAAGWFCALAGTALVLPPVIQISNNISMATMMMTQEWRDLRMAHGVCGVWTLLVYAMLVRPFNIQPVFPDGQIAFVEHLGDNVDTVLEVEVNEVGRSVLYFVKRGLFLGGGTDVSEFVIVVNGRYAERLFIALELVIELKRLDRILHPECLFAFFRFLPVVLRCCLDIGHLRGQHKSGRAVKRLKHGLVCRLDKDFEIGLPAAVAGLVQQQRIDIPCSRDERDIGAAVGLGGLDVAEVLDAFDDPEILVTHHEVQNLLRSGQDDQGGKADLRLDRANEI